MGTLLLERRLAHAAQPTCRHIWAQSCTRTSGVLLPPPPDPPWSQSSLSVSPERCLTPFLQKAPLDYYFLPGHIPLKLDDFGNNHERK